MKLGSSRDNTSNHALELTSTARERGWTQTVLENFYQRKLDEWGVDIQLNGSRDWDMQINDPSVYFSMMLRGSLAVGEAYMNQQWESRNLALWFDKILAHQGVHKGLSTLILDQLSRIRNRQTRSDTELMARGTYDVGEDLLTSMLGAHMQYSCAYWVDDSLSLDEAQQAKFDLIARKLDLQPGMKVLDIGCGYGSLMNYLKHDYQVEIVGLSVSADQKKYAVEHYPEIADNFLLEDYREFCYRTDQVFDRIVSVGMLCHVGYKNYRKFFECARHCIRDDGLFLLHCIGNNNSTTAGDPWIDKYIFHGGMLASPKQVLEASEPQFFAEDVHNFGYSYHKTTDEWLRRSRLFFASEENWKYDARFQRMWEYYLTLCSANFKKRHIQLYQYLLSPRGTSRLGAARIL